MIRKEAGGKDENKRDDRNSNLLAGLDLHKHSMVMRNNRKIRYCAQRCLFLLDFFLICESSMH